jgi:parvulin-like peptidyl-prolyl isomerase
VNRSPSRLAAAPLVVLLVASLVLSACSTGDPAAATVNGHDVSRHDLQEDVRALAGNEAFVKNLKQRGFQGSFTEDSVPAQLTSLWLTTLVQQEVIGSAVAKRNLKVTKQDRAEARTAMESSQSLFGPKATFEKFPGWFQDQLVDQQAATSVLRDAVQVSPAVIQQFYDQNKAQLCPSGHLISHILVDTKEQADAVEAQLAQGVPYDQLAANASRDTTSGANGGRLTCVGSQDWAQVDQSFRTAAEAVPVGTISAPVQTQFGFHVIRSEDFTLQNATPLIRQLIEQQADPLTTLLNRQLKQARVTVDPRFGRVSRTAQGFTIEPPRSRTPKSRPSPSSTTTTTAPAGSQGSGQQPGASTGG